MITYSKQFFGLHLLFRPYGSPLPRALPGGVASVAFYLILNFTIPISYWESISRNPYILNGFLGMIGIIIAFRANHSYDRYWEGRTQLQNMTTTLVGMVSSALAHEAASIDGERADKSGFNEKGRPDWTVADKSRMKSFSDELLHLTSLLHALFLMHLRCDWKLGNIVTYDHNSSPPAEDAAGIKGHKVSIKDVFFLRDDAEVRKKYNALCPLPVIGSLTIPERFALGEQNEDMAITVKETLFSGTSIGARAWADQQRLLHDLAQAENNVNNNNELPGIIVSSEEGTRLDPTPLSKKNKKKEEEEYKGKFHFIHQALEGQLGYDIPGATERVYTAHGWLHALIGKKTHPKYGWSGASPPTSANVIFAVNSSLVHFEQCNKITTCPFPFPYAQVVIYLLIVITFILPIVVLPVTPGAWVGCLVVYFTSMSFWAVNEVARDIETCFGMDPNDLALSKQQWLLCKAIQSSADAILADYTGKCPHIEGK